MEYWLSLPTHYLFGAIPPRTTRCGLYCRFHARKRDSGFTEIGTKPAVRSADKAKLKKKVKQKTTFGPRGLQTPSSRRPPPGK
jgi:hypothetical protein